MRIVQVTFEKKWNLGDYNSELINAVAVIDEGENPSAVLKELIAYVKTKGETEIQGVAQTQPTTTETKKEKVDKPKKEKVEKTSTENKEEAQDGKEKSEKQSQASEKSEQSEVKETKKVKGKATPYDPDASLHKKLLGEILDKAAPGWKTNTAPYKEASQAMRGKDFLDAEGLVLENFKTEFIGKVPATK